MYKRIIEESLVSICFSGKAIIIYGPRQVGKTTLAKGLMNHFPEKKTLYINADEIEMQQLLSPNLKTLAQIVTPVDMILIDEAQRIENIGLIIKLLVDTYPNKQIIATGSSSFDLANKITEPLTGRAHIYKLYPLSLEETDPISPLTPSLIEQKLIYGSYPDVLIPKKTPPTRYLKTLLDEYLYKDILTLDGIKKHRLIHDILQALALQIGSEFSYRKIANTVGSNKETVEKYIDILEQAFIITLLRPLHTNQRREIKGNKKVFFRDLGVRNALIGNFNPLVARNDAGALWENFFLIERVKYTTYHQLLSWNYFWRRKDAGEIDYIEHWNDHYTCYECKFSDKKGAKVPAKFAQHYPNHTFHVVQPGNVGEWVR